ncbi:hypothetical protein [Stutzerimonas nitrititolerans]|uniref:hypothetical protein n=1 Tax=Stutzerimonas nitrititolerans TaxID=2482751 RepID=UPI0028A81CBE|nr:hypothetical protein [Stutzerimonas nitrititolerans]
MNVNKLKALAEAVRADNATYGDPDMYEPRLGLSGVEAEFAKAANPAAILKLIEQNEALAGLHKMHQETEAREMRELRAENRRLSRRAKSLARALAWFSSLHVGVMKPKWLLSTLAKEAA